MATDTTFEFQNHICLIISMLWFRQKLSIFHNYLIFKYIAISEKKAACDKRESRAKKLKPIVVFLVGEMLETLFKKRRASVSEKRAECAMLDNRFGLRISRALQENTVYSFEGPEEDGIQHNILVQVGESPLPLF